MAATTNPTPRPGVEYLPGDLVAEPDTEGRAAQDDVVWIDEQYNCGALKPYRGEYIAVVSKTILGHGRRLKTLREDVSRATGHPLERIVTSYIDGVTR